MSDEKNKVDTTTEIKNSEMKKAEIKKADANVKTMEDFTSPEILYDELIASVKKYHPSTDISMIEKAYKIAYEAHEVRRENPENHISFIRFALRSFWQIWSWTKRRSLQDCFTMWLRTRS